MSRFLLRHVAQLSFWKDNMDTFGSDSIGYCQSTVLNQKMYCSGPHFNQYVWFFFLLFSWKLNRVQVPCKLDFTVFLVILSNKTANKTSTFLLLLSDLRHSYYCQNYFLSIFVNFKSYFKNSGFRKSTPLSTSPSLSPPPTWVLSYQMNVYVNSLKSQISSGVIENGGYFEY